MQDNGEWMGPEDAESASAPNNEGVWDLSRPVPAPVSPPSAWSERGLQSAVDLYMELVRDTPVDDPSYPHYHATLTQMRIAMAQLHHTARLVEQNDMIINRLDQIACNQR